jgi:hypothetical protein
MAALEVLPGDRRRQVQQHSVNLGHQGRLRPIGHAADLLPADGGSDLTPPASSQYGVGKLALITKYGIAPV